MRVKVYGYPKCSTCRKAYKWLEANGIEVEGYHIVENPPTKEELNELIKQSKLPIQKFFNVSGQRYRQLQLKDRLSSMSDDEKIALLASDGMLIKRPIVTDGEIVTVGFKEEQFEEVWRKG